MNCRFLACLMVLTCLSAADDVQLPWVPGTLDDWPALQRRAATYATEMRAAGRTLFPHPGTEFYGERNRSPGVNLPMPPAGTGAGDLIILDLMISVGPQSSQGCGQIVVWRGADGKAIGSTIYLGWDQLLKGNPPLFADEASYLKRLTELIAETPPPTGAWKVEKGNDYWYAVWQRAGGKAATLDTNRGVAPELRPEDRKWLLAGPAATRAPKSPPLLDDKTYRTRVDGHAVVQAALKRARSGYPAHPVALGSVVDGSQAAASGWKQGDVIVSIDGQPLTESTGSFMIKRLRSLKQGDNLFVMLRPDGTGYETRVKPGTLGVTLTELAGDPGMLVLRLVPAKDVDLAVAWYALDDPAMVATAMRHLGSNLGVPLTSYLYAWHASFTNDYGRSDALLSAKAVSSDIHLREAAAELAQANRLRSGRLLWADPGFEREASHPMLLRHLVKSLTPAERFFTIDGGAPAQGFTQTAADVRPVYNASEVLLREGTGTLASTDQVLRVEVRLDAIPARCRLAFEVQLQSVKLSRQGDMMGSPVQQCLTLSFGLGGKSGATSVGCGGVRLWLDGSIEMAGASLDPHEFEPTWHTVPGRVIIDGTGWNSIVMTRIGQTQHIAVNGHTVLDAWLPLAAEAADQDVSMFLDCHALETPIRGFRLTMPKAPAEVSNF